MNGCDRLLIDRYANGLATPAEMETIEEHLLTCSACEEYLDELLREAKSTIDLEQRRVPDGVRGRIFKDRPRIPRLVWGLGLGAAVAVVLVLRRPTLEATGVTGIVRIDGRAIPVGASVASGSQLALTGPSSISFGGLVVVSSAPVNRFGIVKDGVRWRIVDPLFPVDVLHLGGKLAYGAQAGSMKLDPSGTRFRVWRDGLEVYESEVLVTNKFGTQTKCSAGRKYLDGKLTPIDDDPTRFTIAPYYLPATLQSWVGAGSATFETGPSREALAKIDRLSLDAPGALSRIALILARDFDMDACAEVIERIMSDNPALEDLGDAEAEELLGFLVGFGEEPNLGSAKAFAHARGWRSWDDLVGSDLPKRIAAARHTVPTASNPSARLALVSAAVRAAIESQVDAGGRGLDLGTLRWAQLETQRLLESGRLDKRGRAAALGVLAEAQYYVPETEERSVDTLRQSVALWRTPERVAHLCARVSEISTPTLTDRSDLVHAFVAKPTYRSAERVLTFLRDNAATSLDRSVLLEFAHWIGDHYRSVANAQAVAAEHLMDRSADEALSYFQQAERLVDGRWSELDAQHGEAFAIALWRAGGNKPGDRRAADLIAERCGLYAPLGYRFFLEAGLYDEAVARLTQATGGSAEHSAERGRVLREAGRSMEAAAAYQRVIEASGGTMSTLEAVDAALSIAELVQSSNPRRSAELAQRVLAVDLSTLERGWRRNRQYSSLFRARAHWILGDRNRSVAELEGFLNGSAWEEVKRPERARLKLWRAASKASLASPRSSGSRRTR